MNKNKLDLNQDALNNISNNQMSAVAYRDIIKDKNNQHTPSYLDIYGLREHAFSDAFDDKFFYLDNDRAQILSSLYNLIQDKNLFLILRGVAGVGKSSVIKRFITIGDESWHYSYFSATSRMSSEQLYFNISAGFGMTGLSDKNKSNKDNCIQTVAILESNTIVPILIIDNVDKLPIDTLKSVFELVNRWDKNHPKLRIILITGPDFDEKLESDDIKPLHSIISNRLEIKPLVDEQVARYIKFRLSTAGLEDGSPFKTKVISKITKQSKGIPKDINSLCHTELVNGMEKLNMDIFIDTHNFKFPLKKYLITGSLMVVFLTAIFGVFDFGLIYDFTSNQFTKVYGIDTTNIGNDNLTSEKNFLEDSGVTQNQVSNLITLQQQNSNAVVNITTSEPEFSNPIVVYEFSQISFVFSQSLSNYNSQVLTEIPKIQAKFSQQEELIKTAKALAIKKTNKHKVAKKSTITESIQSVSSLPSKSITNVKKPSSNMKTAIVTESSKANKTNSDLAKYDVDKLTTIKNKNFPTVKLIKGNGVVNKNKEMTVSLYGSGFSSDSKITIYGNGGLDDVHSNKITYISKSQINLRIIPEDYVGKSWIVVTDPVHGKSNSKSVTFSDLRVTDLKNTNKRFLEDTDWILAQKSNLYTLQIVGSVYKKDVMKLATNKHIKFKGQFALFETYSNGTEWHHLIIGTYKDKKSAKLAVQNFPNKSQKPWVRPLKDIQDIIKRSNQKKLSQTK